MWKSTIISEPACSETIEPTTLDLISSELRVIESTIVSVSAEVFPFQEPLADLSFNILLWAYLSLVPDVFSSAIVDILIVSSVLLVPRHWRPVFDTIVSSSVWSTLSVPAFCWRGLTEPICTFIHWLSQVWLSLVLVNLASLIGVLLRDSLLMHVLFGNSFSWLECFFDWLLLWNLVFT